MGFWDRLMGREEEPARRAPAEQRPMSDDEVAVERYRYLLRTAPAATIEQVHEEAFAKLTPEQRSLVYRELGENAAPGDEPISDDPRALARSATRSEMRNPGTMERAFARGPGATAAGTGGPTFGSMLGASLLGTVAGYVVGSALVSAFLPPVGYDQAGADQSGSEGQDQAESGDAGSGDASSGDYSATGGDFGGGDFGGGDFGGGDFGGGDFGGF